MKKQEIKYLIDSATYLNQGMAFLLAREQQNRDSVPGGGISPPTDPPPSPPDDDD